MIMEKVLTASAHFAVAEIELVYRLKVKASQRPSICSSHDAYNVLKSTWDENKIDFVEQFKILLLNRNNKVLALYEVSSGGITETIADPRIIFSAALKVNAVSLILSHNHPSGGLKPSKADEEITLKIKEAGKYLDIKVLDHIIVGEDAYFSFADEGLI